MLRKTRFAAHKCYCSRRKFILFSTSGENAGFLRRNNLIALYFSAISPMFLSPIGEKNACSGLYLTLEKVGKEVWGWMRHLFRAFNTASLLRMTCYWDFNITLRKQHFFTQNCLLFASSMRLYLHFASKCWWYFIMSGSTFLVSPDGIWGRVFSRKHLSWQ